MSSGPILRKHDSAHMSVLPNPEGMGCQLEEYPLREQVPAAAPMNWYCKSSISGLYVVALSCNRGQRAKRSLREVRGETDALPT